MKKRIISLLLVLVTICSLAVVTTGCGKKNADGEVEQRYAWPLATCSTTDTITHVFASNFARLVGEYSDGAMKIQVYPQSALGGDRELMESVKDGDIPFVVMSPAPQVPFMPELCIFDSPCLYADIEDVRLAYNNPEFMDAVRHIYDKAGYQILGLADQGYRVMTTNYEYNDMSFFKGQKIRTMENAYHIAFWKAVKANPTPMSFAEVYIGLQQGTIDAQENAYSLIQSARLYEQQKYIVETNAVPDFITLVASADFMAERTEDEKAIILKAAEEAQQIACDTADSQREQCKKELEETGMKIQEIKPDDWTLMQEASQSVYDKIIKVTGQDLFDLYSAVAREKNK
ncbi:MAG: TRAP transporter substrate-binding protein [Lachnospiraceae bacterium]|nr:TRAP transporter substrate-binding protein [Lachnospiraceae bacterium]